MSNRSRLVGAALAALAVTRAAGAQAPVGPTAIPASCTYATCALRVENGFLSSGLVRGASGERVGGRLSAFGGGIEPLLAGPDSAQTYARAYVRDTRRGATLGLLGSIAAIALFVRTEGRTSGDVDDTSTALAAASVGFAVAAIPFMIRAQRDLSRSVWWYNSALPR